MSGTTGARSAAATALALLAIGVLALATRSLSFEHVFVDGDVVFPPADAQYHLRRAFYSFVRFPSALLFDPFLSFPDGAPVPWPPLFDHALGGVARLLASDRLGFERVAAWSGPVLGALTILPVYLAARRLGGRGVGLGAAALLALLPAHVFYSQVGNADHHAASAFLGAWLLWGCLGLLDPAAGRAPAIGLALARAAMLLTWPGSLLYLALVDGLLLLAGALGGARTLARRHALGALASLSLVAPVLAVSPTPLGGDYSAITLSRLHAVVMGCVALLAGGLDLLPGRGRLATPARRLAWLAGAGAALGIGLLALPGIREGLAPALAFGTLRDGAGAVTSEQDPLFPLGGRVAKAPARWLFGHLAYAIPLAPLVALGLGVARRSPPLLGLGGFALLFGGLTLTQRRYGNDLAPALVVLSALLLAELGRWLARRAGARPAAGALAAVALGALMLAPGLDGALRKRALHSLAALGGAERGPPLRHEQLDRFARRVRDATPATAGFLDASERPEYGVLAPPNLGHLLKYRGERPTSADPFWSKLGPRNFARVRAFMASRDEEEARALAERLGARFVVTRSGRPGTVLDRLHRLDGSQGEGGPALGRFRLVSEADPPAPGEPPPHKLFERVEGARLTLRGEPGSPWSATLGVASPTGRRLRWRAAGALDPEGAARLRLPYATGAPPPVATQAAYRVVVGGRRLEVRASEADVLEGRVLPPADGP